jgi:hypothetical protein
VRLCCALSPATVVAFVAHAPRAGRLYALEQGLSLPERSADTNALLGALMQQLEARPAARRA